MSEIQRNFEARVSDYAGRAWKAFQETDPSLLESERIDQAIENAAPELKHPDPEHSSGYDTLLRLAIKDALTHKLAAAQRTRSKRLSDAKRNERFHQARLGDTDEE